MKSETIIVNGTVYDAVTGMPVDNLSVSAPAKEPVAKKPAKSSHHIHQRLGASRTINRAQASIASKPQVQSRPAVDRAARNPAPKSPVITRFAPQPSKAVNRPRTMDDITPAAAHPVAQKASERLAQSHTNQATQPVFKPSSLIKQEAIDDAMNRAPEHNPIKAMKRARRMPRIASFASGAFALLLLAGYLTYINLPNLSVRVAANQAGIEASYPGYRPDGYRLAGVDYDQGSVSLKFAANAGPQKFTITQQQTNWDSTAVKENYVKTNWGDNVVPYSERGLTIYAHDGNAAWVNGGILYTITGDAPLSASQVRGIATSL